MERFIRHGRIYTRPATVIRCLVELSAFWAETLTWLRMVSAPVRGITVDTCTAAAGFADTVKLYNTFGGVVLDEQEGQHICEALGENGKAVILQNHGILSAAQTVDATIAFYIRLEQLCESQLIADAAGEPLTMANKDIQLVFARNGGEEAAWEQAQELFELVDQVSGGDYKL